jgi:hypothetical protein
LSDGRLLVSGGHLDTFVGLPSAAAYDWRTNGWSSVPSMSAGRWYPTNTVLGNGEISAVSGSESPTVINPSVELFSGRTNTWRSLNGLSLSWTYTYPFVFLRSGGDLLVAGREAAARIVSVHGVGGWISGPSGIQDRENGSAAMFGDRQVMIVGGSVSGLAPTASAQVLLLDAAASANWRSVSGLANPRQFHTATTLPDGSVLVTGGTSAGGFNVGPGLLSAELFDPVLETWRSLASMKASRVYHSTALLLADGRVLVGGGGQPSPAGALDRLDAEIFSPPYLFEGSRPVVTSAPAGVTYGSTLGIATPNPAAIRQVTLVRMGSVTHGFDQNQRFHAFAPSVSNGLVRVTIPSTPHSIPPGHYLAFLIDALGVPSVGRVVKISLGACADGIDNDGDGAIDFDGGEFAATGPTAPDSFCSMLTSASEAPPGCGIGPELAPGLFAIGWLSARRRQRQGSDSRHDSPA